MEQRPTVQCNLLNLSIYYYSLLTEKKIKILCVVSFVLPTYLPRIQVCIVGGVVWLEMYSMCLACPTKCSRKSFVLVCSLDLDGRENHIF
jgi:hypothetical protein